MTLWPGEPVLGARGEPATAFLGVRKGVGWFDAALLLRGCAEPRTSGTRSDWPDAGVSPSTLAPGAPARPAADGASSSRALAPEASAPERPAAADGVSMARRMRCRSADSLPLLRLALPRALGCAAGVRSRLGVGPMARIACAVSARRASMVGPTSAALLCRLWRFFFFRAAARSFSRILERSKGAAKGSGWPWSSRRA